MDLLYISIAELLKTTSFKPLLKCQLHNLPEKNPPYNTLAELNKFPMLNSKWRSLRVLLKELIVFMMMLLVASRPLYLTKKSRLQMRNG